MRREFVLLKKCIDQKNIVDQKKYISNLLKKICRKKKKVLLNKKPAPAICTDECDDNNGESDTTIYTSIYRPTPTYTDHSQKI
jgi:hypothetical protein